MNPTHGQVCAARTVLVKYSRWTQVVLATNWRHRENILCQTTWRSISVHRVISRPHDLALMLFVDKLSDGHFTGQTQSNSPDRICPITESIHGFQLDRCRLARCAMQLIFPSNHWRIYISANRLWEAKWVSAYRKAGVRRKKVLNAGLLQPEIPCRPVNCWCRCKTQTFDRRINWAKAIHFHWRASC